MATPLAVAGFFLVGGPEAAFRALHLRRLYPLTPHDRLLAELRKGVLR